MQSYTIANAAVLLYFVVIMQTHQFAVQIRDVSDVACLILAILGRILTSIPIRS